MDELKADYKRGLVVAISFCVFVMPLLLPKTEDMGIISLFDKEGADNLNDDSTNTEEKGTDEAAETEVNFDHQDSVDNGNFQTDSLNNDDVVDGPTPLYIQFSSSVSFPNLAKERLLDGIKEVLEEQTKSSLHRIASMDYQTSL